jgi:hypothetical protein
MDITTLAKDLAVFLTPFLPYLMKVGEKAAEKSGEQIGEKVVPGLGQRAWETAKSLWGKIHPKIESKPAAQEAVKDVVATPKDADAVANLRLQLKKLLTEDTGLAKELAQMMEEKQNAEIIAQGISNSIVVIGNGNVTQVGKQNMNTR